MDGWLEWAGRVAPAPDPLRPTMVCVECGCPSLTMPDHHLVCDCETCDVPSDERGLVAEMRRRSGDPDWFKR